MIKGLTQKKQEKEDIENPKEGRPMIKFIKSLKKKDLVGVEIGSLYGFNARSILLNLDIKKLYLIDPYELYSEYLDITTPFAYFAKRKLQEILKSFMNKIKMIKKASYDAVFDIKESLDFVYIDGNHSYKYVLEDIENYWPLIKEGGILGGHDYYNTTKAREVKKAVDEWIETNKIKLYVDGIDWWVVK